MQLKVTNFHIVKELVTRVELAILAIFDGIGETPTTAMSIP
jgi:hypothetical protein